MLPEPRSRLARSCVRLPQNGQEETGPLAARPRRRADEVLLPAVRGLLPRGPGRAARPGVLSVIFLDERSGSPASTRVEGRPRETASCKRHPARAGASPPSASGAGTRCCAGRPRAPTGRKGPPRPRGPTAWTASDPSRRAARDYYADRPLNSSQPSSVACVADSSAVGACRVYTSRTISDP